MTKSFLTHFLTRWIISCLGLFIATALLGNNNFAIGDNFTSQILVAGLVFSLINMALKPLLILLSLPALILSLGLFMLIVNGVVVLIASWLDNAIYVKNFGMAILVGVILGLVNLLVSKALKDVK